MKYIQYTPDKDCNWKESLIDCYKAVFAAPPWNEDWWTDILVQEVLDQYAGQNACILVAIHEDSIIGFAFGAVWAKSELHTELELVLPEINSQNVAYVKDIGVSEPFRKKGVAETLLKKLIAVMTKSCASNDWIFARTLARPKPSVVYKWFPSLGFRVVSEYPEENPRRGQVILGCCLKSITFK